MRRALPLLAGIAALCVLAAGCGGGAGKRLSKAEFVTTADGICKKYNDKSNAIKPDLPPTFDPTSSDATAEQLDKFGDFLDASIGLFRDEVGELRDVNPPEELDGDYNKALSLLDKALNVGDDAAKAAHDADRKKLNEKLTESQKHSNAANALAKKLGLTVCAGS
jgi:hypothetical protein